MLGVQINFLCKVCKIRAHHNSISIYESNDFKVIRIDLMKTLSKIYIYTPILHTHFWTIPYWRGGGCAKLGMH